MRVRVGSRVVGNLMDGKLIKRGKQAVLFRLYDGFGVAESVLQDYPVEEVEVHYEDKVYTATRRAYLDNGLLHTQRGYETQVVLPRRFFSVDDPKQTQLLLDGIRRK